MNSIKCDLIVVSCDTVTNIDLYKMVNEFRKNSASIVTQLFKNGLDADTIVPGPKTKHKQGEIDQSTHNFNEYQYHWSIVLGYLERDLIGIQPHTNRLTFLASASDFEETLDLPYHLLHRYGHIVMHTQAIDSHIYILKKWIVDFLHMVIIVAGFFLLSRSSSIRIGLMLFCFIFSSFFQNDSLDSMKGELIPYIVKKQMSKFLHQHAQPAEHEKHVNASVVNVNVDDIFNFVSQNELDRKIKDTSLYNDSANRQPFNDDLIRCFALRPQENRFGIRVNTILAYCAINQKVDRSLAVSISYFHASKLIKFICSLCCRFLICGTKYFHRMHHHWYHPRAIIDQHKWLIVRWPTMRLSRRKHHWKTVASGRTAVSMWKHAFQIAF